MAEERGGGLADHVSLARRGVLERRHEGAHVQAEAVLTKPVAVLLEGYQLSPGQQLAERAVEDVVPEALAEVANDDGIRPIAGLLEFREVQLHLVGHQQRHAPVAALATVLDCQQRGGDQLLVPHVEAELAQLLAAWRPVTGTSCW